MIDIQIYCETKKHFDWIEDIIKILFPKRVLEIFHIVFSDYTSFSVLDEDFNWKDLEFENYQFPLTEFDIKLCIEQSLD